MTSLSTSLLCFVAVSAGLAAQDAAAIAAALPLRVPIHTGPDDPCGGAYGLWAVGPAYKVSFHDGFAFYPYIAGQERPQAWHWRTEAVGVDGELQPVAAPELRHTDARCTLLREGLQEIYDVRDDGVEQSFVFAAKPTTVGDLLVVGRVTTPFVAAPVSARVGALEFADVQGRPVVRYGQALAFDARGAKVDVATAFDGERIVLRMPAEFVGRATFPLTIDPLTAVAIVNLNSAGPVRGTSITADTAPGSHVCLVGVVREFASGDHDVFAYRIHDDGTLLGLLFTDVTTNWSTTKVDTAESGTDARWLLAMLREFPNNPNPSGARAYVHVQSSPTLNSGTVVFLSDGTHVDPRIGGNHGSASSNRALMVYGSAPAGSSATVRGALLDTTRSVLLATFDLHGSAPVLGDSFEPHVNKSAAGGEAWRVTWAESVNATDRTIRVAVVANDGMVGAVRPIATAPGARAPRIAGAERRYLATWLANPVSGTLQLNARRFDMQESGTVSAVRDHVLATVPSSLGVLLFNGDLAYDIETRSHWVSSYHRRTSIIPSSTSAFVARMGYTGGVVESASIHPSTAEGVGNASVAYAGLPGSGERGKFVVSFSTTTPSQPAYFRGFDYALGSGAFYGTSCRSNTYADGHPPYAGSEFYYTGVHGLPVGTPAVAFVGFGPADLPLDVLGMPGCRALVDSVISVGASAEASGFARLSLPLADAPVFRGNLFVQWAWFAPGANALGLVTAGGVRIDVQ